MADLKTNYVDDVLDTTKNQLRKYQQIQNDDGTVSFVDVTEYTQVGTSFGAKDINDTNAAINDVNGKLQIKNIYSGKATVSSADWIAVTVEFGGTVTDTSKIVPMVVGFQIYGGNHVPNIMINEITKTSFIASCYGLSAFRWVVLELY